MGKTIAIIELYQHDEVLRHYCEMLRDSDYNIKVFCSKAVYDCLEDFRTEAQFDWVVQKERETNAFFLKQYDTTFKSFDLLFITTALSDFRAFYELSKINKTVLLVHNVHSFLEPNKHLSFEKPIADRLRWLNLSVKRAHFYKKSMLSTLAALVFPTDGIVSYVKKRFDLDRRINTLSLPFSYTKRWPPATGDITTITIPGTVNPELRDYPLVFQAFSELQDSLSQKVRLVLLGMPVYGGALFLEQFQTLKKDKIDLVLFEQFIPPEEYENWLLKTDFLILPLKAHGRNYIYQEHFGHSKISGSINDMIRYGLPSIISNTYPLEEELLPLTDSYTSARDLTELIKKWLADKTYLEKRQQSKSKLEKYSREKVRTDFLTKVALLLKY